MVEIESENDKMSWCCLRCCDLMWHKCMNNDSFLFLSFLLIICLHRFWRMETDDERHSTVLVD